MERINKLLILIIVCSSVSSLDVTAKVTQLKRTIRPTVQKTPPVKFGVGLYGGGVKMVLGKIDRSTIDQWVGLHFRYILDSNSSLSLNTAYGWVQSRNPKTSHFTANHQFKTILIPTTLNLNLVFTTRRMVHPYITLGFGATYWDVRDIREVKDSIFSPGSTVNGGKTSASFVAGAGFEVFMLYNFALDLNFRYYQLLKGDEDTIGSGDDNRAIVEVRACFNFYWSTYKDTDKDGIEDKHDLDPLAPEDFDGFQDNDGIPDFDNDNDGIPDRLDKAPLKPEDVDGYRDQDGVPDPDNDRDGIPDKKDRCPNDAEDYDGYEDKDGCPEEDNDSDGIPDSQDKCPNYPETFNGYQDGDGCPDEKPAAKVDPEPEGLKKMVPVLLKGVNFKTGSAVLLPGSQGHLIEIAQLLLRYPKIQIEIRGYTDNVGSEYTNQILSRKRAESVRRFLIDCGIAAERLRAVGMGESNPIASNATPQGRALNRRIEFVRIQ